MSDTESQSSKLSWADIVEEEEREQREAAQKRKKKEKNKRLKSREPVYSPADVGRELYVGGLVFSDLDFNNTIKPAKRFKLRDSRRSLILKTFDQFGEVEGVRTHWNKRYLFVVFKFATSAHACFDALSQHDVRVKITKEFEKDLQMRRQDKRAAPRPNFYVRWPKDQQKDNESGQYTKEDATNNIKQQHNGESCDKEDCCSMLIDQEDEETSQQCHPSANNSDMAGASFTTATAPVLTLSSF